MFKGFEDSNFMQEFNTTGAILSPFIPPPTQERVKGFLQYVVSLLNLICKPVDLILHWDLGEREFSALTVVNVMIALNIYSIVSSFFQTIFLGMLRSNGLSGVVSVERSSMVILPGVQVLFLIMSAIHLIRIEYRKYHDIEWHSRSLGVSIFEYHVAPWLNAKLANLTIAGRWPVTFRIDSWFIYRWVEPLLCYLAAQLVIPLDTFTGSWLTLAAFTMFFRNALVFSAARQIVLNAMDARIESEIMADLLTKKKPPQEMSGYWSLPGIERVAPGGDLDIHNRLKKTLNTN